jgi:hypothetical protein
MLMIVCIAKNILPNIQRETHECPLKLCMFNLVHREKEGTRERSTERVRNTERERERRE